MATLAAGEIPLGKTTRVTIFAQGKLKVQGETRTDAVCDLPFVVKSEKDWLKIYVSEPGPVLVRLPRTLDRVAVQNPTGEAEVYDLDGETTIRAARRVTANNLGKTSVDTMGGNVRVGRVGAFRCVTGGGLVQVDFAEEVDVESRGGDIVVGEARGKVSARTLGGNIRVERAGGAVNLQTAGGSIEVGASNGAVCRSGAGGIRLKNSGGAVFAETGRGTVLVEFAGPARSSQLSTAWGDIVVFLPSNLALNVEAEIENPALPGTVVSEFREVPGGGRQAAGALNGGGPLLKIVGGGDIRLRRKAIEEK